MLQGTASYLNSAFSCSKEFACFRAAYFQPTFSKYNSTAVPAVQWLHERLDLKCPSNGYVAEARLGLAGNSEREKLPKSSLFEAAVKVLVGLRSLSSPPEAFVWDGSWFGHPGTELIDSYAGMAAADQALLNHDPNHDPYAAD